MTYEVHNIVFEGDALVIAYIELPTDVRVEGQVVLQRQIRASLEHPDYEEDTVKLHDRAVKILRNILEDFANSEPYVPKDPADKYDTEHDDEKGMGE